MKKARDFSNKPYSKCLTCPHLGTSCRGRTSDLSREHWCEFMAALMEKFGYTESYVAAQSGASMHTVNRIATLKCDQDFMRDTVLSIENVLLGTARDYPCLLDLDRRDVVAEAQAFRDTIESLNATHQTELEAVRADMQATIDALREQLADIRAENALKAQIIKKSM